METHVPATISLSLLFLFLSSQSHVDTLPVILFSLLFAYKKQTIPAFWEGEREDQQSGVVRYTKTGEPMATLFSTIFPLFFLFYFEI
ncbi:hypothetical protein RchiOBHm_Chr4g0391411 [Rosa chinensis]|uniref:Uncharacterized protein n=1 Tax=Rosa chinensis TaxID=74649 RepID=A0A2P6QQH8_ROSCH|nr:hypothetical protein RchiOBHm_Chr4g0391411 [Rosa chinensis]